MVAAVGLRLTVVAAGLRLMVVVAGLRLMAAAGWAGAASATAADLLSMAVVVAAGRRAAGLSRLRTNTA